MQTIVFIITSLILSAIVGFTIYSIIRENEDITKKHIITYILIVGVMTILGYFNLLPPYM